MTDLDQCERELDAAHRVNAEAVGVMAQACARPGISLVQVSADHFFTGDRDRLHDETAPVHLVNEYARSEFAGEALAMTAPRRWWCGQISPACAAGRARPSLNGRSMPCATASRWCCSAIYFTSTIDAGSLARAILDLVDRKASGLCQRGSARGCEQAPVHGGSGAGHGHKA